MPRLPKIIFQRRQRCWNKPRCYWRYTVRRIISGAALAKGALKKPTRPRWHWHLLPLKKRKSYSRKLMRGRQSWPRVSAQSQSKRSCTKSCLSQIKTRRNTKPWCKRHGARKRRRWCCCKRQARSRARINSIGSGFCLRRWGKPRREPPLCPLARTFPLLRRGKQTPNSLT